jgi:hypothetical protein
MSPQYIQRGQQNEKDPANYNYREIDQKFFQNESSIIKKLKLAQIVTENRPIINTRITMAEFQAKAGNTRITR